MEVASAHEMIPTMFELTTLLRAVGDGAAIAASEHVRRREADLVQREAEHAGFLAHDVRNSIASRALRVRALAPARLRRSALARRHHRRRAAPGRRAHRRRARRRPRARRRRLVGARVSAPAARRDRGRAASAGGRAADLHRRRGREQPERPRRRAPVALGAREPGQQRREVLLRRRHRDACGRRRAPTSCTFEIGDSCGGIDESLVERLFRPFIQGGEDRTGFGLGLALARECAEAQGGTLRVTNSPGHGCVFTLAIPIER